jgi:hypothetical protein
MSTSYHPQSDGQTKMVNQCWEMYLCCAVQDAPESWTSWLSLAGTIPPTTLHWGAHHSRHCIALKPTLEHHQLFTYPLLSQLLN